jgi:hypothetical protein
MDPSLRPSPDRLTRRDLLRAGLAAGATLAAEPLLAPRPALAQQPRRGGILRVRGYDPPNFDYGNRAATLWLDR